MKILWDEPKRLATLSLRGLDHQLPSGEFKKKVQSMTKSTVANGGLTEAEIATRDAARGFTDADLAEVMDNPEWTDEELRNAKPFAEVFPELAASLRRDLGKTKT